MRKILHCWSFSVSDVSDADAGVMLHPLNSSMISLAWHFIDCPVCRHFRAGDGRRPDDCWRRYGLNNVSWQAAMIAATPPGMTGTASGLFQASRNMGSILSSVALGLAFGKETNSRAFSNIREYFDRCECRKLLLEFQNEGYASGSGLTGQRSSRGAPKGRFRPLAASLQARESSSTSRLIIADEEASA